MVDVKHLDRLESVGNHRRFRKRLERQWRDKLPSVVRHNDVHVCAQFFETRHYLARFVNGNSAAHAQHNVLSVQHKNLPADKIAYVQSRTILILSS